MNDRIIASRRDALRISVAAVVGVAAACGACRRAVAAENKLAKSVVQYTEAGAPPGTDCDDCIQYIAGATKKDPATCKIVEGTISAHGHCIAFSPKARS